MKVSSVCCVLVCLFLVASAKKQENEVKSSKGSPRKVQKQAAEEVIADQVQVQEELPVIHTERRVEDLVPEVEPKTAETVPLKACSDGKETVESTTCKQKKGGKTETVAKSRKSEAEVKPKKSETEVKSKKSETEVKSKKSETEVKSKKSKGKEPKQNQKEGKQSKNSKSGKSSKSEKNSKSEKGQKKGDKKSKSKK